MNAGPAPGAPHRTLADEAAARIVALIEDQDLAPGSVIPAEGELARRFGINRLVVREAVRTLVAREVLESRQGRPARVTVPSAAVLGQILDFRLRQRTLQFADLLDTRRLIEVELAGRAAERIGRGEGDATVAARLLTQAIGRASDRGRFIELDIAFHDELANLAGAETLHLLLTSLAGVLRRARQASYDGRVRRGQDHRSTLDHHAAVLDAVVAGDPRRAREAMSAHLAETERDLASFRPTY